MILGAVVLAVILAFIFGYFVMLLWNWIMPALFGLPEIDYWMAFGIIILARLIFGGLGNGSKDHKSSDHHSRYYESKFKRKWKGNNCRSSKWTHYENYWEEEGEKAFNEYVERKKQGNNLPDQKEDPAE
jgi:hypothetical protein